MTLWGKKRIPGQFFDVTHKNPRTIDLKPTFSRRHPSRIFAIIAGIVLVAFLAEHSLIRADVQSFHAGSCLGTWQNVHAAEGAPESLESSVVTAETSARYLEHGQVFCGGFIPADHAKEGKINNVSVTFAWQVGTLSAPSSTASSSDPVEEPVDEPPIDNEPPNEESENASSAESAWGRFIAPFVSRVHAHEGEEHAHEEVPVQPVESEPTPEPQPEPEPQPALEPESQPEPEPQSSSTEPADDPAPEQEPVLEETATSSDAEVVATSSTPSSSSTSTASSTDSSASSTASSSEDSDGSVSVILAPEPDDNFLRVRYTLDGSNWIELAKVNPVNWPHFTVSLPVTEWSEAERVQIGIESIPTALTDIPAVHLDGMTLEVHSEIPQVTAAILSAVGLGGGDDTKAPNPTTPASVKPASPPPIIMLPSGEQLEPGGGKDGVFGVHDAPTFHMNLEALPPPTSTTPSSSPPVPVTSPSPSSTDERPQTRAHGGSLVSFFRSLFRLSMPAIAENSGANYLPTKNQPVVAEVIGPDGKPANFKPAITASGANVNVSLPEPNRKFRGGSYRLKVWVWWNDAIYYTERDFTWGVLVVNFDRSVYMLHDTAHAGFAVLDNGGHTICNAHLAMTVTAPSGAVATLTTAKKGGIQYSPSCGPDNVTSEPDYAAVFPLAEEGAYYVTVTAETEAGMRAITDTFEVRANPAFVVTRSGPTRIFPIEPYQMTITVKAHDAFEGRIVESVPAGFIMTPKQFADVRFDRDTQYLSWPVSLVAGEEKQIVYTFDAPDVSPELYKLGPLQFENTSGAVVWQEARTWQIASDAAGDVILLWDGATIPTGWTCVSCAAGDPFFGVFPMGSSTYGSASSSNDTVTHMASSSGSLAGSSGIAARDNGAGTDFTFTGHTHTLPDTTTGSGDIRPPFRNLKFISANNPSQIPNGTIGMFDVSSSSLPAGWSYYSAMENNYLRGEGTVANGGSSQHTHSLSGTSDAAGTQKNRNPNSVTVAGNHTHIVSGTITAASNTPPYANAVFGKLTTTSTLPIGIIAMFNATVPSGWTSVSGAGQQFNGRFVRGAGSYGATGGSSTHTHPESAITSQGPSTTHDNNAASPTLGAADSTHTHIFPVYTDTTTSLPIYRHVIFGKKTSAGNQNPVVSNVVLNGGSPIILVPFSTVLVTATASTSDADGAGDIRYATSTIYRSGVSLPCFADNGFCYQIASSSCSFSGSSSTVSCSANIQYYGEATDASSTFPSENWRAVITVTDGSLGTGSSSTASGVELNTLLAIEVTTSSINYGTLAASSTTGSTNQTSTIRNAGNATSTLRVSGTALGSGGANFATSSQHYATSSFTFGGAEQSLTGTPTTVSGLSLSPRNFTGSNIYWGLTVPPGYAPGTYSGVTTFSAVFSP